MALWTHAGTLMTKRKLSSLPGSLAGTEAFQSVATVLSPLWVAKQDWLLEPDFHLWEPVTYLENSCSYPTQGICLGGQFLCSSNLIFHSKDWTEEVRIGDLRCGKIRWPRICKAWFHCFKTSTGSPLKTSESLSYIPATARPAGLGSEALWGCLHFYGPAQSTSKSFLT
jgi:hypothetical protein